MRCNSASCINDEGAGDRRAEIAEGGDPQEVGRRGRRGQGDGEMMYQRVKTYETGLFCFVSPKQVRGWYKPQSGSATRSVEDEA